MSWETISREAQAALLELIPACWLLNVKKYRSLEDVTSVPYTSGIMTKDQLSITELTASEIVKFIESRELKAVQVVEAFAARAAIAHQLAGQCVQQYCYQANLSNRSIVWSIGFWKMVSNRRKSSTRFLPRVGSSKGHCMGFLSL